MQHVTNIRVGVFNRIRSLPRTYTYVAAAVLAVFFVASAGILYGNIINAAPPAIEKLEDYNSDGTTDDFGDAIFDHGDDTYSTVSFNDTEFRVSHMEADGDLLDSDTTQTSAGEPAVPLAYVSSGSQNKSTASSGSMLANTGTGDKRAIVAWVIFRNATNAVTDVSYDGTSMDFLCFDQDTDYAIAMYYLTNPTQGSNTLSFTMSGSIPDIRLGYASAEGVNQASPVRDSNCLSAWNTTVTGNVTTVAGDLVFGANNQYSGGNSQTLTTGGATVMWDDQLGGANSLTSAARISASTTTTSLTWNSSTSWPWATALVALQPDEGTGGGPASIEITLDDATYGDGNNNDYFSHTHTVSGDNRFMLAQVSWQDNDSYTPTIANFQSEVYDYYEWTEVCTTNNGKYYTAMYYLEDPIAGDHDVQVSFSDYVYNVNLSVNSYNNVDPLDPIDNYNCANGDSTTPAVSVSSGEGKHTYAGVMTHHDNMLALGSGMSAVNIGSGYDTRYSGATKAAAATTNFDWTLTGGGGGGTMYALDRNYEELVLIDPTDASTSGTLSLYKSGGDVYGGTGLAYDSTTSTMYALLDTDTNSFILSTVDLGTGEITEIDELDDYYAGIAFDGTGQLYGVTGYGATNPFEIYTINKSTGSESFFMSLTATNGGSTIAYHEGNGYMYWASGDDGYDARLDRINLGTQSVATTYTPSGDYFSKFQGIGYWGGDSDFVGIGTDYFFQISATGSVNEIDYVGISSKGLAYVTSSSTPWAAAAVSLNPIESAAITIDNYISNSDVGPSSYIDTSDMQIAGSQRAAYITVHYSYGSPATSQVDTVELYDYDLDEYYAATFICRSYQGNSVFEQYYVVDPPTSGASNAEVQFTTPVDDLSLHLVSLNGVDKSDPIGESNCEGGTANPIDFNVSTLSTNEYVLSGISGNGNSGSQNLYDRGDTVEINADGTSDLLSMVGSQTADAGTTTVEYELGSPSYEWATGGVAFMNIAANAVEGGGLSGAYRIQDGRGGFYADASGNYYVASNNTNDMDNHQFRISKHDSGGTELWNYTTTLEGGDVYNYANDLVVDGSGNVYIAADMEVSGTTEGKIIKLDSDGAEVDTFDFEDTTSIGSGVADLLLDGTDLYACGYNHYDNSSSYRDMYVQKLSLTGTVAWDDNLGTTIRNAEESCKSMVLDDGTLYTWGLSTQGTSSNSELKATSRWLTASSGAVENGGNVGSVIDTSVLSAEEIYRLVTKDQIIYTDPHIYAVHYEPGTGSRISRWIDTGGYQYTVDYENSSPPMYPSSYAAGITEPYIQTLESYEGTLGDTYIAVGGYDMDSNEQGFVGFNRGSFIETLFPQNHLNIGSNGTDVRVTDMIIDDETVYVSGYDKDGGNGADAYLGRLGWTITTITSSNELFVEANGLELTEHKFMGGAEFTVDVKTSGGTTFAEVPFTYQDTDVSSIDADGEYDAVEYKTWYDGDSPATGATYSIIVAKDGAHNGVRVCPNANSLISITSGCTGETFISDEDAEITDNGSTYTVSGFDVGSTYGIEATTQDTEIDVSEIPFYNYDINGVNQVSPIVKSLNGHLIFASGTGTGRINVSKVRIYDNQTIWEESFENPGGFVTFYNLVLDLDSNGNIFVGADMAIPGEGNNHDFFLIKFDDTGNALWHKSFDGGSTAHDSFDLFFDMNIDMNGNAIITGILEVATETSPYWKQIAGTIKVNGEGVEVWRYIEDEGTLHSYANDITSDDSGNVYVCGGADLDIYGPNRRDFYVSKIDNTTGNNIWTYRASTGNPTNFALEQCEALQVSNTSDMVVAAGMIATGGSGQINWIVVGLTTSAGAAQWSDTMTVGDIPGFAPLYTQDSAYDATNDRVIFGGRDYWSAAGDAFARVYDADDGNTVFTKTIDKTGANDFFNAVATYTDFTGAAHYLALGGYDNAGEEQAMLYSWSESGQQEYEKIYDGGDKAYGTSLAVDSRGIVYTGNLVNPGTQDQGTVLKYAYNVNNLDPALGLKVEAMPGIEVDLTTHGYGGAFEATLTNGGGIPIAQFDMGLLGDVDWSTVTAEREGLKAFVHFGLGFENTPGINASTFSLLVPRPANASQVIICPGAIQIDDINDVCAGKIIKNLTDLDVDITTFQGQEYFKINGLTGTGGVPINDASAVRDTLTREQISTDSDHNVEFGTTLGIDSTGDTIELDFDDNFDFSAITITDIDLHVNSTDVTLCAGPLDCSAAAGTWGVALNATTNVLTFTAPTDASAGEIDPADTINVIIGLAADDGGAGANQVTNPATVGSYEVRIEITNSATEVGELEVPIIDDDTVNVSGYIDTFITFDIDTSEIDEDCDASGGATPCDSHAGTTDDAGYVVDLGELTLSTVNVSGNSVAHDDGNTGLINYIWMDLSTNANGGAVVSVFSLNDAMTTGASDIPSVGAGEVEITAGDGLYGLQNRFLDLKNAVSGDIVINDDCDTDGGNTYFCSVGGASGRTLFTSNGAVVDQGRVQFRVGASPDALDTTGTYTDELTFIATATF